MDSSDIVDAKELREKYLDQGYIDINQLDDNAEFDLIIAALKAYAPPS